MEEEIIYRMPIKVIRQLLLKEHDEKVTSVRNICHLGSFNLNGQTMYVDPDVIEDYFGDALLAVRDEIIRIQSYEDADKFIGAHCRMSLSEWIESL